MYAKVLERMLYSPVRQNQGINTSTGVHILTLSYLTSIISRNYHYFQLGRQWPTAAHRYCGNNTPIDYLSSYRTIYVHFKSNEQNEASGFKFTAKIFSGKSFVWTSLLLEYSISMLKMKHKTISDNCFNSFRVCTKLHATARPLICQTIGRL